MDLLHTSGTLNNGKKLDYAFGLFIKEYKGLKTVSHGGAWAGFRAGFVRFPEQKFSVICLANLSSQDPDSLCYKVADIYLAGLLKEEEKAEEKKAEPIVLSKQELAAKAGNYFDAKYNAWASVSLKEDKLMLAIYGLDLVLAPLSRTQFDALDAPVDIALEFLADANGKQITAVVKVRGAERYRLAKAAPLSPLGPAQLKEYAGDYVSGELLGARYKLVAGKEGLSLKFRSMPSAPFKAMARDQFDLEGITFAFFRKGGGKHRRLQTQHGPRRQHRVREKIGVLPGASAFLALRLWPWARGPGYPFPLIRTRADHQGHQAGFVLGVGGRALFWKSTTQDSDPVKPSPVRIACRNSIRMPAGGSGKEVKRRA